MASVAASGQPARAQGDGRPLRVQQGIVAAGADSGQTADANDPSAGRSRSGPSAGRRSAAPQVDSYAAQFDALTERFAAVYPSFPYKGVDWSAQSAAYRARALRARSQDDFIAIVREMLEPLNDLHVWLIDPRGIEVPTYRPPHVANFDRGRWGRAMRDAGYSSHVQDAGDGIVGGYGYIYLASWNAPVDSALLDAMLSRVRDTPGLILDLRTNAGGSDAMALQFVSRFAAQPTLVSYVQTRNGPNMTDLDRPLARVAAPSGGWQFTRPVVVLTGRAGFSATETFVAALRTLPNVTVVGDTTGGASGNPATFMLGNGWQFTVPQWIERGPDHEPIEGRGVAPHLVIPWSPEKYDRARDPLIDAAVGLLGEITGVYRIVPAAVGSGSGSGSGADAAGAARDQSRQRGRQ